MKNFTLNPEMELMSIGKLTSDLGQKIKEDHIQDIFTNFLASLPDITKNALNTSADEKYKIKSKSQVSLRNESMISANIQNETRILDDVAMIEELLKQAEEKNIIEKVDANDVSASFDNIIGENATIGHGFDRLRGDSPIHSLETMESVTETDIENFTKSSVNDETVQNLTKTAIEHIANETSFVENVTKSNVKKHVTNTITNINETLHSNNTETDDADNSLQLMYNFHLILLCILLIFILIVIIRMFPTILQKLKKRLIWRTVNLNSPVKRLRIMDVNLQSMSPWNGAAYLVQEDNNSHLVQEDNHSPTDTNTEFSFVGSHATTSHDSSMRYIRRSHDSSMTYVNRVYQHDNDLDRTIEYEMSPENLI